MRDHGMGQHSASAPDGRPPRRRPPDYQRPDFGEPKTWWPEPWSIWCDWRRHSRLLDTWIGQVRFYQNNLLLSTRDEPELTDRFLDVVDMRAFLYPDHAPQYHRAAASMCEAVAGRFLPEHVIRHYEDEMEWHSATDGATDGAAAATDETVLEELDRYLEGASKWAAGAGGYYVDRHMEQRPSAWQAADAIVSALEVTRPLYETLLPAPRQRRWSVGADLTIAWVRTVSYVHHEDYFRVPDPSDPMGIFDHRWFGYEDYLTPAARDFYEHEHSPGPNADPLTMDYFPINGPVADFTIPHAEPWMITAYDRAAEAANRRYETGGQ